MSDRHNFRFCILALSVCLVEQSSGIIHHKGECESSPPHPRHGNKLIEKVTFTQKGYIQFLKYVKEVPVITEYTFCVWLRSHNLTYNHPLLSYSKHEEERLIRVWITPSGRSIKLEISNQPIFEVPLKVSECEWHHYCQSWSSYQGAWSVFFDGKLLSHGYAPQLKGTFIKGGGDIVVGQEYTDFDKGLDDGIEGDVFGFNFVLSPTMKILDSRYKKSGFTMAKVLNHYKPPGLSLVELTYDCSYKNGAPSVGKEVLINWTKSPVRVFGGAILKRVPPFCK